MNEVTVIPADPEPQEFNLPAVRPKMEVSSPIDMDPAQFAAALDRRSANRKVLMDWIRDALVDGTDFGTIPTKRGPSKPSLWKSGAEKICGMLNVTATFPTLPEYEKSAIAGAEIKSIVLRCELINSSGAMLGSGIGARSVEDDDGDLNKALKMAQKSAHIDATLRMAGLSQLFTQDIEDKKASPDAYKGSPGDQQPFKPAPVTPPKPSAPWDLDRFEAYCMARLVEKAKGNWAWWKYAAEARWILPTETIDALVVAGHRSSGAVSIFNLNPNVLPQENRDRAAKAFKAHEAAVSAMTQAMPPEECELAEEAFKTISAKAVGVRQPPAPITTHQAPAAPAPAAAAPPQPAAPRPPEGACPNCNSTATKPSEKYTDTTWCEKCGWQWDGEGNYWEAHPFNYAVCPIPPKGTKKRDYKPQTLGQIARTESNRWFGLVMNVTEEKARRGYTTPQGKHYPASQEEIAFGAACELAKAEKDANDQGPPKQKQQQMPIPDDDVPF